MKNKFVTVLCALLLFIPTIAAFFVYNPNSDSLIGDPSLISDGEVIDDDGRIFSITTAEDIALLTSLLSGEKVDTVPDQVLSYEQLRITFRADEQSDTYTVYASSKYTDSIYYQNSKGNYFKADNVYTERFLSSPYCVSLYDVTPPVLTAGELPVIPSKMEWKYKQVDDSYAIYNDIETTAEVFDIGRTEQDLGLSFSIQPDTAYITVYEDGEAHPTRLLSEFTGIKTAEEKVFTAIIKAEWSTGDGGVGTAEYTMSATVKADAVFNVWTTSSSHTDQLFTEPGGIVVLAAKNAELSKLTCEISPKPMAEGFTPVFYQDGDNVYTVIPTTYDTTPGKYDITLKYGDDAHTFTVEVKEKEFSDKFYDVKKSKAEEIFSDANMQAIDTLQKTVFALPTSQKYLGTDEFDYPGDVTTHRTGYGITMYIEVIGKEFRHGGTDIRAKKGSDVLASTDGTIVYVGEDAILGGVIVIDHGMGVRSWYCRIDTEGAVVGTQVKGGDIIATADESGFGDDERVHFAVTVGDKYVSPQWLYEHGFTLPIV